ncbi:hypothetical protein FN846DRAFT_944818 [Sphaerosporella brunnea]|uniref:3-hydroxyacyl-CoA dehydrogenase C-terminal domain-containing protein n=1 Tax=Sphaerosporella brunnea TaxID=1250544 RepID=A0A5J5EZ95_9PEZI|nr:hypothetical protein FN846DRAFT_944818 [Sphaerosporella brunnea]
MLLLAGFFCMKSAYRTDLGGGSRESRTYDYLFRPLRSRRGRFQLCSKSLLSRAELAPKKCYKHLIDFDYEHCGRTSDRVVSTHSVPVQKGVDTISGLQTSNRAKARGKILSPAMLRDSWHVNETVVCWETGVGERDDIGTNVPVGPLQLAGFIGLDTCLAIMKVLDTVDGKYRPAVLLKKYVGAGWLGKKSGRGFYDYTK